MTRIAIFASGRGSNARRIMEHVADMDDIAVDLVLSNKPDAAVLELAKTFNVDTLIIEREAFYHGNIYLRELQKRQINWIALAGFLWLIPQNIIDAFRGRIINIHPALLPNYGGKGMYGMRVHQAVKKAGEQESGITIHQVNEAYDEGQIIFQARCPIEKTDSPEEIAGKVLELEHRYYPVVLEQLIRQTQEH